MEGFFGLKNILYFLFHFYFGSQKRITVVNKITQGLNIY